MWGVGCHCVWGGIKVVWGDWWVRLSSVLHMGDWGLCGPRADFC